jgi:peptidoglycan-N-acetylglucosamine deacetylase
VSFDITLTFDNGPEADVTPFVLSVLADWGIRSSFFVIGEKAEREFDLSARAHEAGHWIGNHTWSHSVPLGRIGNPDLEEAEIVRTQMAIGALAHRDKLFRPIGGGGVLGKHLLSLRAVQLLVQEQFTCVLWNSVPQDWRDPDGWVDRALQQCDARPWTVMVLHDLKRDAMENLPEFLTRATARGARFRQEFPEECLPIFRGRLAPNVEQFVSS